MMLYPAMNKLTEYIPNRYMMVNVVGCLGVCTYALIGMKLKPDWFDGKLVMTATQIDEQARLMAIEEMKKNAPAPAAAEEAAADYALD